MPKKCEDLLEANVIKLSKYTYKLLFKKFVE